MAPSVADEVRSGHAWLLEGGYRITSEGHAPGHFGDGHATLDGPGIRLRLLRDRGQVWAEVAAPGAPEAWWPFEEVCAAALGHAGAGAPTMPATMARLRERLPAVAARVRGDWPALLSRLEARRARRRR